MTNPRSLILAAAALGAGLYSASQGAGTPPARSWDLRSVIRPAPVAPPVAVVPAPPIVVPAPVPPAPPVIVAPSPVIIPPLVTPRPIVKESAARKPKQPRQKPDAEAYEWMPPCWMVCQYAAGKTRAQLESEAASRRPSARLRQHALVCMAACRK